MPEPSPLRSSAEVLKVVFLVDGKPDHKDIHSSTPIPVMIQVSGGSEEFLFSKSISLFYLGFNGATQDGGERG